MEGCARTPDGLEGVLVTLWAPLGGQYVAMFDPSMKEETASKHLYCVCTCVRACGRAGVHVCVYACACGSPSTDLLQCTKTANTMHAGEVGCNKAPQNMQWPKKCKKGFI